ncbi:hypothetical protein GYMLUDRAFT_173768 [Collybiopsis luxurians FD-317 M1]|uniref:Peroxidase n=1 Tax=Collybiopsis luxurians FD-317 M1 TaxID=944289 RepID=A0A0D0B1H8_9AGAR|nr:hypothetical protein GYMLUDRAFT_173768 [Collybiopsis luxurians FD-317 M1]
MKLCSQPLFAPVLIVCALGGLVQSFSTFQWPNPLLSYADQQLYEGPLEVLAEGCPPRDNSTIPAQWLRIAYHDMSTHNVDDGTGGLDASIQYELDRSQNVGEGMLDSLNDFNGFGIVSPFFGMADVIALGAVLAVAGCGGPFVPFSAGRVDATEAGPPTVPEPQQDLASHTESFRRQGFTPTEMIALVACGHTLGGVRQVDFPLVVTDNSTILQTFDTTPAFDTAVVSEYLQNTTQNPLVVGPNVTTRSDFRIFSSDGNVTMQSLLSPANFNQTCSSLFERMLNTVPSNVNLTDPITEPFDYLVMNNNPSRTVTLLWADRQESFCPSSGCSQQSNGTQNVFFTIIGQMQGVTALRYQFNATINATSSISKFWFEVNENDGSEPIVVDNGGAGFVVEQDSVFVDVARSELVLVESGGEFDEFIKLVVAVRGDGASTSASVTSFSPSLSGNPPFTPTINTTDLQLDASNPPEGGYTFFTMNTTFLVTFLDVTGTSSSGTVTQKNFDMTANNFPFVLIS